MFTVPHHPNRVLSPFRRYCNIASNSYMLPMNTLYNGDNLNILRDDVNDESARRPSIS